MKLFLLSALILLCFHLGARGQANPLRELAEVPAWKEGLKTGTVPGWIYYSDIDMSDRMTSTSLIKYRVPNVSDGISSTAWATTNNNNGIGEVIAVDVESSSNTWWIWNGFGKSSSTYLANNRPKKIKVYLLGSYCNECTSSFCVVGNLVVVNSIEVELQDVNEFQRLPIPQRRIIDNSGSCGFIKPTNDDQRNYVFKLAIEILSVYKGSETDNTFISEIMDHGKYTEWLDRKGKK